MWQDTYNSQNMMGWDWFMGFNGLFSLFSLAVIVFAVVALYRDWRRDQLDDRDWGKTEHE